MGNDIKKCCNVCAKLQDEETSCETRYIEITSIKNRTYKCKKFYISSEPITVHKINEVVIFTDATLTMKIANTSLKLPSDDMDKLQEAIKADLYNNNIVIKDGCFVLDAIEEEAESSFAEFKDFPDQTGNETSEQQRLNNQQKPFENQISAFSLRSKSRAFRFRNPLRHLAIAQFIIVIVPLFQQAQDIASLKEGVEQSLSMAEDLKSVGVSQISYMLGYEPVVFQKIILEYILGYSKTRKNYVFKRIKEFYYLSYDPMSMTSFFKYLNIYTKNKLEKLENSETKESLSEPKVTKINKLGNGKSKTSFLHDHEKKGITMGHNRSCSTIPADQSPPSIALSPIRNNSDIDQSSYSHNSLNGTHLKSGSILHGNDRSSSNSFHNNSLYHPNHLSVGDNRFNGMAGYKGRTGKPSENRCDSNASRVSENTEIGNIRLGSFRSKESSVSDYF